MLFRKKIVGSCEYCAYGTRLDSEQMLCTKRGVVSADTACWKFRYDPFKRVPARPKALDFKKYEEDDFSL